MLVATPRLQAKALLSASIEYSYVYRIQLDFIEEITPLLAARYRLSIY